MAAMSCLRPPRQHRPSLRFGRYTHAIPGRPGRLVIGSMLALPGCATGCATGPDVRQLCGVWAFDDAREQWWIDGGDLRGEGRMIRDGVEVPFEILALRKQRGGHVYIAQPGDAAPTEFAPIDPRSAKFGPAEDNPEVLRFSWANYAHDFPQEIHYLLAGDRLTAVVSGPDRESGWQFERTAGCTEAQPKTRP
jgi:hypothetical protein